MRSLVRIVAWTFAAVGASAVAVCAGRGAEGPPPLTAADLKGRWELVEIQSRPVPSTAASAVPVFTISEQSIEGFDGCNTFSGRLDKPGSIVSTRRGCAEGTVKLPLDLADPMSHLKSGRIENGKLILPARAGMAESAFMRAKSKPE
jgi:heat shock protein HslJ